MKNPILSKTLWFWKLNRGSRTRFLPQLRHCFSFQPFGRVPNFDAHQSRTGVGWRARPRRFHRDRLMCQFELPRALLPSARIAGVPLPAGRGDASKRKRKNPVKSEEI